MKNDLGFMILDLQESENYTNFLKEIAIIVKENPYKQICIFNNHCERFDNFNIPLLPVSHAKFFNGDLFLVDSISLMLSKNFPSIKNKYLYIDSVIWKENYNTYTLWQSLLDQKNLSYIATNQTTADLINICWNKKAYVMKQFNAKELINVIQ